jgi:hypothetical protein
MKSFLKVMLALVVIILGIVIYVNTNFYIVKQSWKYRDGLHIGDWVEFEKGQVKLKGRKIYRNGEQVANIKFCMGNLLIVSSIKTGESGYYVNKS